MKENSKLINGGFNKWMEILAGKDLPTKLGKSKNVAMIEIQREQWHSKLRQMQSTRERGYSNHKYALYKQ